MSPAVWLAHQLSALDGAEIVKVVGGEHLSLDDGKVDFNLIKPTGMNRAVDEDKPGIFITSDTSAYSEKARPLQVWKSGHPAFGSILIAIGIALSFIGLAASDAPAQFKSSVPYDSGPFFSILESNYVYPSN
jgi:hypothetical protein